MRWLQSMRSWFPFMDPLQTALGSMEGWGWVAWYSTWSSNSGVSCPTQVKEWLATSWVITVARAGQEGRMRVSREHIHLRHTRTTLGVLQPLFGAVDPGGSGGPPSGPGSIFPEKMPWSESPWAAVVLLLLQQRQRGRRTPGELGLWLLVTTQPLHFPQKHNYQESKLLEIIFRSDDGSQGLVDGDSVRHTLIISSPLSYLFSTCVCVSVSQSCPTLWPHEL